MNKELVIKQTIEFVKKTLKDDITGHDFWHAYRVWKIAVQIANNEGADMITVELSALLHDIADAKINNGDDIIGLEKVRNWLENSDIDVKRVKHICDIIENISFSKNVSSKNITTKEGMIVQDADRLDATGAMGISRTFTYGGFIKRPLHDPDIKPRDHKSNEEYQRYGNSSSINHFYEKLLLLKDLMNTDTAKKIAERRHRYMKQFLDEFYTEWEGKDLD